MRAENIFKNYLRAQNLKFTPERRVVFEAIMSFPGHFDADALFDWLKHKNTKISRATVYRALPHFISAGLVKEALRAEGRTTYENVYGSEHHDHLVCIGCGAIIEFKDDRIEALQNRVCEQYGFKPLDHKLGIRGYCKNCRKNEIKSQAGSK
jgi:Fur family transcriptional regulator, ferric uptake regulator